MGTCLIITTYSYPSPPPRLLPAGTLACSVAPVTSTTQAYQAARQHAMALTWAPVCAAAAQRASGLRSLGFPGVVHVQRVRDLHAAVCAAEATAWHQSTPVTAPVQVTGEDQPQQ
jgi:hypothetical protein